MNYLPTCTSRLVVQHPCQVSFKSMQGCRRSWEDKLWWDRMTEWRNDGRTEGQTKQTLNAPLPFYGGGIKIIYMQIHSNMYTIMYTVHEHVHVNVSEIHFVQISHRHSHHCLHYERIWWQSPLFYPWWCECGPVLFASGCVQVLSVQRIHSQIPIPAPTLRSHTIIVIYICNIINVDKPCLFLVVSQSFLLEKKKQPKAVWLDSEAIPKLILWVMYTIPFGLMGHRFSTF